MLTVMLGSRWVFRVIRDPIARSLWCVEGINRDHPEQTSRVTFSGPNAQRDAERYALWMSSRR